MPPKGRKNRKNAPKSGTPKSKGVGKKTPTIRESIQELDARVKGLREGSQRSPSASPEVRQSQPGVDPVSVESEVESTPRAERVRPGAFKSPRSKEWSEDEEIKLCELWKDEEHLYNKKCADYRNGSLRQTTLLRLSTQLEKDVQLIRTHMDSLRTTFGKIKDLPSGSRAANLTDRQRHIRKICKFLQNHVNSRKTVDNLRRSPRRNIITHAAAQARKKAGEMGPSTSGERASGSMQDPAPSDDDEEDDFYATPMPDLSPTQPASRPLTKSGMMHKIMPKKTFDTVSLDSESPSIHPPPGKRAAEKETKYDVVEKKNQCLTSMANSINAMSNVYSTSMNDSNVQWGRLLGIKVNKLPENIQEAFKIHCDNKVFKAMSGTWPENEDG